MKTWYVEDAGGGCQAFGEVVVLVCEETGEIYTDRVPITWTNKMGLEELVCQKMLALMKEANTSCTDKFLVCSGNIFNIFHNWLKEHHYNWETHKMDGLAHEAAEGEFHRMVVEAGFPRWIMLEERNYRRYYRQIEKWVGDHPARKKLYWKDREVRKKPAKPRYILKSTMARIRICHHCHKQIVPFSPMVELKLRQDGSRLRYFYHPECSPAKPLKTHLNKLEVNWNGGKLTGIIVPCPETIYCSICGQPIEPGYKTFYAYDHSLLICGHPDCFGKGYQGKPLSQTI